MFKTLSTSIAACLLAGIASAQTTPQTDPQDKPTYGKDTQTLDRSRAGAGQLDEFLATWLLSDNNKEIALAELALRESDDGEVKAFAQRMLDEHNQLAQKLQPFAKKMARPGSIGQADRDRTGTGSTTGSQSGSGAGQSTAGGGSTREDDPIARAGTAIGSAMGDQHTAIIDELGRKCLQSATEALQEKDGDEFDRCYVNMMVMAHEDALNKIEVFKNHASSELRQVLEQGQQTIMAHLEHAKDLAEKVNEDAG